MTARVVKAALALLTWFVEAAELLTRGGRQRRRARVLAEAERAEAVQRAQAFSRILGVRLD